MLLLDEHVGHVVLWLGYFSFWAVLLAGSRLACVIDVRVCGAAVVMGATHAIGIIESSHPELCVLPLLVAVVAVRCRHTAPALFCAFTCIFATCLLLTVAAYHIVVRGSKLFEMLPRLLRVEPRFFLLPCAIAFYMLSFSPHTRSSSVHSNSPAKWAVCFLQRGWLPQSSSAALPSLFVRAMVSVLRSYRSPEFSQCDVQQLRNFACRDVAPCFL
jgi:hypothetical protein